MDKPDVPYVEFIVEQTDLMDGKMSQIKMTMAVGLAKQLGKVGIDMTIKKDACDECVMHSVPHYHFIGYENGNG